MPRARTVQHALKFLRSNGYTAEVVERWVPMKPSTTVLWPKPRHGVRKDLFGVADIVAFSNKETLLVQVCAASGLAAHKRTIQASATAEAWRSYYCNRAVVIITMKKRKVKRGGKAFRYVCEWHTWAGSDIWSRPGGERE